MLTAPGIRRVYYGWIIVVLSFLISIIAVGVTFSFGVFLKPLEEEFGWTRATISWAPGIYMLVHLAVAPLTGWFTDRHGPKIMVALGGVLTGLGLLLTSWMNAPWQLYIYYGLLVGMGMGGISVPLVTTVSRWFVERRGLAIAIYTSGSGVGMITLAPLIRHIISAYSWRTSFLVIALAAWVVIIAAAFFLKKQPEERASSYEEVTAEKKQDAAPESTGLTLRQALRTSAFWSIFAIYTIWSIAQMMVTYHLVAYAEDVGIAKMTAAVLLSVIGGVSIIGRLGIGIASDRFGRKPFLVLCFVLMGLIMLWLIESTSVWMFCLFGAIWGIATGGVGPVVLAWIGELFGLRHMGVIIGLLALEFGIGAAVGPPMAGYIYDTTGSYSIAFLTGTILMLVSAVVASLLKAPRTEGWSPGEAAQ